MGDVLGTRGPACSLDGGESWSWLGRETVRATEEGVAFDYAFPTTADEVRFAFAMPYLQRDLATFLHSHGELVRETLCRSRQGRDVELLRRDELDLEPANHLGDGHELEHIRFVHELMQPLAAELVIEPEPL